METIPETDELVESNELVDKYIHRIRDLLILDEAMIRQIRTFTHEEKMEIIVAMNEVIQCLHSLLD